MSEPDTNPGTLRPDGGPSRAPRDGAMSPLKIVPTVYPTSPPLAECVDRFWRAGEGLADVALRIEPPEAPLAILEKLGPSPFPRGAFPLIGFLATTYDRISRYALEQGGYSEEA